MVKEEILRKLRSAEDDTAKGVTAAKEEANELLRSARREAEQLIAQASEDARKAEEQKVAEERKRLEKERERILAEGARKEQALRAAYQKRVAQHVDKAIATFERSA